MAVVGGPLGRGHVQLGGVREKRCSSAGIARARSGGRPSPGHGRADSAGERATAGAVQPFDADMAHAQVEWGRACRGCAGERRRREYR